MKIFQDRKAEKLFTETYSKMDPMSASLFGQRVRSLANDKISSGPDDYDEYYVTLEEVRSIKNSI